MVNNYLEKLNLLHTNIKIISKSKKKIKKTKMSSKTKQVKGIKIFLKKKKEKCSSIIVKKKNKRNLNICEIII